LTLTWLTVQITGLCSVVVDGMILLPKDHVDLARVVVEGTNGRRRLLSAGKRVDEGAGACLPGNLLSALGGDEAQIKYRKANWWDVVRYKPGVKAQLGVAVLTFIGAILAAISAYVGTRSPTTPAFTANAAPWVLGIAWLLATWKLYTEFKL
jgi:hypothetical protein